MLLASVSLGCEDEYPPIPRDQQEFVRYSVDGIDLSRVERPKHWNPAARAA